MYCRWSEATTSLEVQGIGLSYGLIHSPWTRKKTFIPKLHHHLSDTQINNNVISVHQAGYQYNDCTPVTLLLSHLHVSDAPTSNLMISAQPAGYQYNDGTPVTLTCRLSGGNPVATLSWSCPGKSVSGVTQSNGTVAVSMLSLTMDSTYNRQQCTCTASHTIPSFTRTKTETLTVYCKLDTSWYCRKSSLCCKDLRNAIITSWNKWRFPWNWAYALLNDNFADFTSLSPGNSVGGDIVMWRFVCGCVRVCVCRAFPCGHNIDYSFCLITFKLHM